MAFDPTILGSLVDSVVETTDVETSEDAMKQLQEEPESLDEKMKEATWVPMTGTYFPTTGSLTHVRTGPSSFEPARVLASIKVSALGQRLVYQTIAGAKIVGAEAIHASTIRLAKLCRLARLTKTARTDYSMYVNEALKAHGLPVDPDMNWDAYLTTVFRKCAPNRPDYQEEAGFHILIYELFQRDALSKFDPERSPEDVKNLPLEKQLTVYLKGVLRGRVSLGVEYLKSQHPEEEFSGEATETNPGMGEMQDHSEEQDHSQIEIPQEMKAVRKSLETYLRQHKSQNTADQILLIFDIAVGYDPTDRKDDGTTNKKRKDVTSLGVAEEWMAQTGSSWSYFRKLNAQLAEAIETLIDRGDIPASSGLAMIVNDFRSNKLDRINKRREELKKQQPQEEEQAVASVTAAEELFNAESAADVLQTIKAGVQAPYVGGYASALGGPKNVSLLLTVSATAKDQWPNNILENSSYGKFHLSNDGTMECISSHPRTTKFRKTKVKSAEQAVEKLNAFVQALSATAVSASAKTADDDDDDGFYGNYVQSIVNEIHDEWQKPENARKGFGDMMGKIPELAQFVFAMAKLNYQVQNGGFAQWIGNRYCDESGDLLLEMLPTTGILGRIKDLLIELNEILEEAAGDLGVSYQGLSDADEVMSASQSDAAFGKRWADNNSDAIESLQSDFSDVGVSWGGTSDFGDEYTDPFYVEVRDPETRKRVEGSADELYEKFDQRKDEVEQGLADEDGDTPDFYQDLCNLVECLERLAELEEQYNTDYRNGTGGSIDLDHLDSAYYALPNGEALWKEVAHAAESIGLPGVTSSKKAELSAALLKERLASIRAYWNKDEASDMKVAADQYVVCVTGIKDVILYVRKDGDKLSYTQNQRRATPMSKDEAQAWADENGGWIEPFSGAKTKGPHYLQSETTPIQGSDAGEISDLAKKCIDILYSFNVRPKNKSDRREMLLSEAYRWRFPGLTDANVDSVINKVEEILNQNRKTTSALTQGSNMTTTAPTSIRDRVAARKAEKEQSAQRAALKERVAARAASKKEAAPKAEPKPYSTLRDRIAARKAAAAKSLKFATLRRIAEEEPEEVASALLELRDHFAQQLEQVEALCENLGCGVEAEGEPVEASARPRRAGLGKPRKAADKFATLKKVLAEEGADVEEALQELYEGVDETASMVEALAENLDVTLEEPEAAAAE